MTERISPVQAGNLRKYRRPHLKLYGMVATLTASGTGSATEASNPGFCERVSNRVRC